MATTSNRSLVFPVVLIYYFLSCRDVVSAFSSMLQRGGTLETRQYDKTSELAQQLCAHRRTEGRYHCFWLQDHITDPSPRVSVSPLLEKSHTLAIAIFLLSTTVFLSTVPPTNAASTNDGASKAENAKITTGGASTLQSGRTISITRGVNLDGSDFSNQNLKGVAFQQSIVRDAKFTNSNLVGSSFFDATLDGSDFENSGR